MTAGFAGQILAGIGAILTLLGPFALALSAAGIACLLLGVIISAPQARHSGPFMVEWWTVLAVATLVCLVGFAVAFGVPGVGGVLSAGGAVVALVAVGLGAPVEG